jgi:hypothetical protein
MRDRTDFSLHHNVAPQCHRLLMQANEDTAPTKARLNGAPPPALAHAREKFEVQHCARHHLVFAGPGYASRRAKDVHDAPAQPMRDSGVSQDIACTRAEAPRNSRRVPYIRGHTPLTHPRCPARHDAPAHPMCK